MKYFKFFPALLVMASISLVACSSDEPVSDSNSTPKMDNLKMNRLNLDNAKYLTLGEADGSRADSRETLFKIDADGNTSAVVLECVEQEDGSTNTNTYNLEVMPKEVYNLTKSWMFLRDCEFYCAASENIGSLLFEKYSYPSGSFGFNILADKKTGKVYYVPDTQAEYFFSYNCYDGDMSDFCSEDVAGNLYTTAGPNVGLSKVSVTSEGAVISKLGPATLNLSGKPYPLSNGTIVLLNGYDATNTITAVYPNGGYEIKEFSNYYDSSIDEAYICHNSGDSFNLVVNRKMPDNYTLELSAVSVGSAYGSISVSEPLISHSNNVWNLTTWLFPLYLGNRFIIFGNLMAYDKMTCAWLEKDFLDPEYFIVPTEKNTYQGRSWNVWYNGATWMDINTLETGTIAFDYPSELEKYSESQNIPGGESFVYAMDPRDGKSYVYKFDITTGAATRTEIIYSSTSITLIPLN